VSFVITTDPIMPLGDFKGMLSIADDQQAIMFLNALSAKFLRFTSRVQINLNTTTAIVEKLRPYGGDTLHLHAPIYTGSGFTIAADVVEAGITQTAYTLAAGDLHYVTTDTASRIILSAGCWPSEMFNGTINVTYKGGWASVPSDVIQGALLQGKVDINRLKGDVGVTSRGSQGESTAFENAGIVREVIDLWRPYRVMA